jgi:hypothetical protein
MVGDVDAVNLIALRIAYVAIQSTPTEAEGAHKEVIEKVEINSDDASASQPIRPAGKSLQ